MNHKFKVITLLTLINLHSDLVPEPANCCCTIIIYNKYMFAEENKIYSNMDIIKSSGTTSTYILYIYTWLQLSSPANNSHNKPNLVCMNNIKLLLLFCFAFWLNDLVARLKIMAELNGDLGQTFDHSSPHRPFWFHFHSETLSLRVVLLIQSTSLPLTGL